MYVCVYLCVCDLLQLLKGDGTEEEDGVKQQETETKPAVQPPAVQVNTQDLRESGKREEGVKEGNGVLTEKVILFLHTVLGGSDMGIMYNIQTVQYTTLFQNSTYNYRNTACRVYESG